MQETAITVFKIQLTFFNFLLQEYFGDSKDEKKLIYEYKNKKLIIEYKELEFGTGDRIDAYIKYEGRSDELWKKFKRIEERLKLSEDVPKKKRKGWNSFRI